MSTLGPRAKDGRAATRPNRPSDVKQEMDWANDNAKYFRALADGAISEVAQTAHAHLVWLADHLRDVDGRGAAHALFTPGRSLSHFARGFESDEDDNDDEIPVTAKKATSNLTLASQSLDEHSIMNATPTAANSRARGNILKPKTPQPDPAPILEKPHQEKESISIPSDKTNTVPRSPIRDSSVLGTSRVRQLRVPKFSIHRVTSDDEDDTAYKKAPAKQSTIGGSIPSLDEILQKQLATRQNQQQNQPKQVAETKLTVGENLDKPLSNAIVPANDTVADGISKQSKAESPVKPPTPQKRIVAALESTENVNESPVKRARLSENGIVDETPKPSRARPASADPSMIQRENSSTPPAPSKTAANLTEAGAQNSKAPRERASGRFQHLKGRIALMSQKNKQASLVPNSLPTTAPIPTPAAGLQAKESDRTADVIQSVQGATKKRSLESFEDALEYQDANVPSSQDDAASRAATRSLAATKLSKFTKPAAVKPMGVPNLSPSLDKNSEPSKDEETSNQPPKITSKDSLNTSGGVGTGSNIHVDVNLAPGLINGNLGTNRNEEINQVDSKDEMSDVDMSIDEEDIGAALREDVAASTESVLSSNADKIEKTVNLATGALERRSNMAETGLEDEIPKTPEARKPSSNGNDGLSKTVQSEGWGGGIKWVGEKILSSLLPSSGQPAPIETKKASLMETPKVVPAAATSRLVIKKDGISGTGSSSAMSVVALQKEARAKEAARKKAIEEEKLAAAEATIQLSDDRNQSKGLEKIIAQGKQQVPSSSDSFKNESAQIYVDLAGCGDEADMEICSQSQLNENENAPQTKSKLAAPLASRLPAPSHISQTAKAVVADVQPLSSSAAAITDFSVPLSFKNPHATTNTASTSATPKAFPRHNPSTAKTTKLVQSILKPATPSFDSKLAERQKKSGLPHAIVSQLHKTGSIFANPGGVAAGVGAVPTDAIKNPILGGLFEKKKEAAIAASSAQIKSSDNGEKGKKASGSATIVDENGNLPDIADSDDDDDASSDEDDQQEVQPVQVKTPGKKNEPKRPAWVETPALMKTLVEQKMKDPDAIFGAVKPLSLEDVFKGGRVQKRFRDSMAGNWEGHGALTKEEEEAYKQDMGFQ
ncbi:hypothetical protein BJ741DRAFT_703943 [Chytriomyces cf. hyalinus JEL632]|nr:hypothetical protein BJ741DRAFT_703943 [Chytriomyces cf. hyalinus JEL632]